MLNIYDPDDLSSDEKIYMRFFILRNTVINCQTYSNLGSLKSQHLPNDEKYVQEIMTSLINKKYIVNDGYKGCICLTDKGKSYLNSK
jgi:hypothetical protein